MALILRTCRYTGGTLALALIMLAASRHTVAVAHALFLYGTPNADDTVATAPVQIDAFFAENVVRQSGTYGLKVTDSSGNQVDNANTTIDDSNRRHMTVTLQQGLGPDTYNVHWWTVSDEDGDAASGDYSFTVSGS